MSPSKDKIIRTTILHWSKENPRALPWKDTQDGYKIWVSEIILQQTRVQQGTPYYHRFIETFPDVFSLAASSLDQVYKVWEGLGYYRRARHMHEAAKSIVDRYQGVFPNTYTEILQLKGVGPYTAAAIASFAFDLPYPVLDGNVTRVLARLFGVEDEIGSTKAKKQFEQYADQVFAADQPAAFNQAMMDFGALQCKPQRPECTHCPLQKQCAAYQGGKVDTLPKKKKRAARKRRYFYYIIYKNEEDHGLWIRKRAGEDIWQNLYEFFLVEHAEPVEWSKILQDLPSIAHLEKVSDTYQQLLTHQHIYASFAEVVSASSAIEEKVGDMMLVYPENLRNFTFPKVIDCYLSDNSVTLNLTF